jgi:phenylacetate-coenzyme A ligase PaaK-like adenylate-forming protein
VVAVGCPHGTGLHIQSDRVVVEIQRADGQIRGEGPGEILVTNLFNWAQPFVRYRLGDRGVVAVVDCPCGFNGPTLVSLPGRNLARYVVPELGTVDSVDLERVLDRPDVKQFEVTQQIDGRLLIRWIPATPEHARATEADLTRVLASLLLRWFVLEQSDQITLVGGKRLRFAKTRLAHYYERHPERRPVGAPWYMRR